MKKLLPLLVLLAGLPAEAAVFRVTKTADTLDAACDHDCSLREAIAAANASPGKDVVLAGPGVHTLSRTGVKEDGGAFGDLDVRDGLVILGAGADRTAIDGGGIDRVLDVVFREASLELHGVTVRNGHALREDGGGIRTFGLLSLAGCLVAGNRADRYGGGIAAADLDARDSTVSGNEAFAGGGILALDRLVLENVTVSGNRATFAGGGLLLFSPQNTLAQVTVTGNSAASGGGIAIDNDDEFCPPGPCEPSIHVLTRSVVAGNSAAEGPDCHGSFAESGGFNVFGVGAGCEPVATDRAGTAAAPLDPRLSALGGSGGPTPTHALLPDSPALDLAPAGSCPAADQRGLPRAVDGDGDGAPECDAGAVEAAPCEPAAGALCLGGRFRASARWSTPGGAGGAGRAVPLTSDTGAFWFFGPDNLELQVKVLDGCGINQRFWVFLSGLTDVGVEATVEDTVTGERWEHRHAGGSPLPTRLDTGALAGCSAAAPAVGGPPLSLPPAGSVLRVGKTADTLDGVCDRDCSLRDAVYAATLRFGADVILLGPGVYALTRAGRGENGSRAGDLDVEGGHLMILGAGADRTAIDGGGIDRVLHVLRDASLELHDLTVQNGWAQAIADVDFGHGGGIFAEGRLRIERSVVASNRSDSQGGGIQAGHLSVVGTTVSGNRSGWYGGGLHAGPWVRMANSTVSGNQARHGGGMIVLDGDVRIDQTTVAGNAAEKSAGGLLRTFPICFEGDPEPCEAATRFSLSRSIVAGNSALELPDCSDLFDNSGGQNRFGIGDRCFPGPTDLAGTPASPLELRLSPLGDHGGPTPTHLPLPGSPAVDAAGETCASRDQREAVRPADGDGDGTPLCDAGAVEAAAGCVAGPTRLCLQAGRFTVTVRWTAQGTSGPGRTVPLTADTGAFWFFDPANLEMTVKVLDGCGINGRFWVFLSGLTDVGAEMTVADTATGRTWTHTHAAGAPLQPRLDTGALEVCP